VKYKLIRSFSHNLSHSFMSGMNYFDGDHIYPHVYALASRVYAPFIAIGVPIIILNGGIVPNQADLDALALQKHELSILVGGGAGAATCGASRNCQNVPSQRSYIVVPRVFRDVAVVSVLRTTPTSTTKSISGGALIWLGMWAACAYLTWSYYLRPGGATSNNLYGVPCQELTCESQSDYFRRRAAQRKERT
jgi:hypothetical protein